MTQAYLHSALLIWSVMTVLFLIATLKKDNSIVDIFWGLGFIVIAFFTLIIGSMSTASIVMTSMITLWGTRLAAHIYTRNHGKPEDFRYKNWRDTWNFFYLRSYFQIFMLQGFLMLLIAAPIVFVNTATTSGLLWLQILGVLIFLIGFYFEAIGDLQLANFIKDPKNKGKIMDQGLWSLTRHPNYFGESTIWWGIFLFSLAQGGYFTLISPLIITFLLLRVSGITMLEKKYEGNQAYQEYKKQVPAFLPRLQNLWKKG